MKLPKLVYDYDDFTKVNIPPIKANPHKGKPDQPRWSVMIPTYNRAAYLEETLKSVLVQDPGPELMQIEVVDDGSTEADSESLVQDIGKGRVGFYKQEKNVGGARNWNTCVERARGKWVQILHDDDVIDPGFYTGLDQLIDQYPDIVVAYTRMKTIDENSAWHGQYEPVPTGMEKTGYWDDAPFHLTSNNMLSVAGALVRRDAFTAVGGFTPDIHCSYDWEMWQRLAYHGKYGFLWDSLGSYRRHSATETDKYIRSAALFRDMLHVMTLGLQRLPADRRVDAEKLGRSNYRGVTRHHCRRLCEKRDWDALYQASTWGYRISPHFKMVRYRILSYIASMLTGR